MADLWEIAYAAGLFDGEGCVQLYMRPGRYDVDPSLRKDNAFRANLSLSSVDPEPMQWVKDRWGGSLRIFDGPARKPHRRLYNLQLTAKDAERFARDILPYLITKREQVELWLEARSMTYARGSHGRPKGGLPEEEVAVRRDLVQRIAALKRKEYSHR